MAQRIQIRLYSPSKKPPYKVDLTTSRISEAFTQNSYINLTDQEIYILSQFTKTVRDKLQGICPLSSRDLEEIGAIFLG